MLRRLPVQFIIPDSGPLMSLAAATLGDPQMMESGKTYLDLLKVFNRQIELIDQVKYECIHREDKPDARLIAEWLERNDNIITEIGTSTGRFFAEQLARGENPSGKHKGELAIDEYLMEFDDYRWSEDIVALVLFEEKKVPKLLDDKRNVHLLSTRAFIQTLDMHRMVNFNRIMDAIQAVDPQRGVMATIVDDPTEASDVDSHWIKGMLDGPK